MGREVSTRVLVRWIEEVQKGLRYCRFISKCGLCGESNITKDGFCDVSAQAESFSEPSMGVYFMITSILTHVGPWNLTLVQIPTVQLPNKWWSSPHTHKSDKNTDTVWRSKIDFCLNQSQVYKMWCCNQIKKRKWYELSCWTHDSITVEKKEKKNQKQQQQQQQCRAWALQMWNLRALCHWMRLHLKWAVTLRAVVFSSKRHFTESLKKAEKQQQNDCSINMADRWWCWRWW